MGVKITQNGVYNDEIVNRIGQTRAATKWVKNILWNKNNVKNKKIRIYITIRENIASFGAELWEISQRNRLRIRAMEMDFWRRCCEKPITDRVKNADFREEIGIDIAIIDTI